MPEKSIRNGGCLCGAIRFKAEGEPKWTGFCHCRSCRQQTGAPVSAYAGYEREAVRFERGLLARFKSSEGVFRGFCSVCGSTLTYEGARWPTEIHLHLGAFDDPASIIPKGHAFADERLPWLRVEAHLGSA